MSGKKTLVQEVEQAQLKSEVPAFAPGDTVTVQVKVKKVPVSVCRRSRVWSLR